MANRRMITQDIFGRADFMELPPACVALYAYLCLWADDDGFVAAPMRLAFMLGYDPLTLNMLKDAGFIICFDKGPCVITHWRMANRIKADRYRPTVYRKELSLLIDGADGYRRKTKGEPAEQPAPEEPPAPATEPAPAAQPEAPPEKAADALQQTPGPAAPPETPAEKAPSPAQEARAPWDDPARIPCTAMPLSDGGLYTPANEQVEEWKALYPDVNVPQELRYIRGWLGCDPRRRRPREAMGALINHWLRGAQEKAASRPKGFPASYNIDRFEQRMNTTVPKLKKRPG